MAYRSGKTAETGPRVRVVFVVSCFLASIDVDVA